MNDGISSGSLMTHNDLEKDSIKERFFTHILQDVKIERQ